MASYILYYSNNIVVLYVGY